MYTLLNADGQTSIFNSLSLGPLQSTNVMIHLANRSVVYPVGFIKDVLVRVGELIFPVDFYEVFCYLNMCIFLRGIFAIYMHIQGILLPKHTYICFVRYFCCIHAYPRYLAT